MNIPHKKSFDWSKPRKYETLVFITVGLLASQIGFRFIGGYLFLGCTYGFSRVHSEHLHLLKMGNGVLWVVSNGDKIEGGGFLWGLMAAGIMFAFFIPTFLIIRRFLPQQKNPG
jgi:hypothetical protein